MCVLIGPMQRPWPAGCQSGSLMRGDGEGVGNYRLIGQLPGTDYLGPIGLSRPAGTLGPAQGMLAPGGMYTVLHHFKLHRTTMHWRKVPHYWLQYTILHFHMCHYRAQHLHIIPLNWTIHLYNYTSSWAGLVLHSVTQLSRHGYQHSSIEGNIHQCNITCSAAGHNYSVHCVMYSWKMSLCRLYAVQI